MEINKNTKLKDVMRSASGHDIIARLLYAIGLDEDLVEKTPLGNIQIKALTKLSLGKLNDSSIDALLRLLNSLKDEVEEDKDVPIREEWWKEAIFYQIYPRSYYDSNQGYYDETRSHQITRCRCDLVLTFL